MDHVAGDPAETPFDSHLVIPRPADLHNSLAQQGHKRGMAGKNPHQSVIRGRDDGIGFALVTPRARPK